MFLKLIGSFLIIVATTFMGFYISWIFSEKVKQIRDIQFALNQLESEIIYSSEPLYIAFNKVGNKFNGPLRNLFMDISEELREHRMDTIYDTFIDCYDKTKDKFYFDEEEIEVIKNFIQGIGSSDFEGQKKNFNIAIKKLEDIEKKVDAKRKSNDKLIKYLGFSFGVVIVVMLF
ncbi:stage III sporulation protein SpoAB [Caloramator mitchellensis]|uniref:Stage III sporulation protein SpoAB n=1 Tax=Caloramator mitchellensis TaxID=908809 RepID=A0A0R3JUV2_CALMK|nr:stage III sporulation protein SpoIIIAB [Caloramator mitchellensis]KRQ86842.1 stage III sporulation protein SpoAB [Caloramator mitchellensis]